jgi:hypothetical protein
MRLGSKERKDRTKTRSKNEKEAQKSGWKGKKEKGIT